MIHFDLEGKEKLIKELTALTEQDDFWKDQNKSKKVIAELNFNKKLIERYQLISKSVDSLLLALNDDLSGDFGIGWTTNTNQEFAIA